MLIGLVVFSECCLKFADVRAGGFPGAGYPRGSNDLHETGIGLRERRLGEVAYRFPWNAITTKIVMVWKGGDVGLGQIFAKFLLGLAAV